MPRNDAHAIRWIETVRARGIVRFHVVRVACWLMSFHHAAYLLLSLRRDRCRRRRVISLASQNRRQPRLSLLDRTVFGLLHVFHKQQYIQGRYDEKRTCLSQNVYTARFAGIVPEIQPLLKIKHEVPVTWVWRETGNTSVRATDRNRRCHGRSFDSTFSVFV